MYTAIAIPSIALLGMGMHRFSHCVGSMVMIILIAVFAAPHAHSWIKNSCNFAAFSVCVLVVHRMQERADRRMWRLRHQLKKQFRATQKAQVSVHHLSFLFVC